ncbi:hypothetical protein Pelo_17205 [Pelomyxa schiedti]|nr:hypothetical protein Pelo_17205 [Pelomyxa schiedti]
METDRRGRRRKAKEQMAVLRGLCVGGHLKMAQRFVENGISDLSKNGSSLCDEFWSKSGVFHIMGEVSRNGHLDVLKWLVLNCGEISKRNELLLCTCLRGAILNGHLHILKWLVGTFDLDDLVSQMGLECSFHPMKGRVSDVKLLVETFPHWHSKTWLLRQHCAKGVQQMRSLKRASGSRIVSR